MEITYYSTTDEKKPLKLLAVVDTDSLSGSAKTKKSKGGKGIRLNRQINPKQQNLRAVDLEFLLQMNVHGKRNTMCSRNLPTMDEMGFITQTESNLFLQQVFNYRGKL